MIDLLFQTEKDKEKERLQKEKEKLKELNPKINSQSEWKNSQKISNLINSKTNGYSGNNKIYQISEDIQRK